MSKMLGIMNKDTNKETKLVFILRTFFIHKSTVAVYEFEFQVKKYT